MLDYLIVIEARPGQAAFCGTFSSDDVQQLCSAHAGKCFDLENYKAYIGADGTISLVKKPDYAEGVILNHKHLCRLAREAQAARHA